MGLWTSLTSRLKNATKEEIEKRRERVDQYLRDEIDRSHSESLLLYKVAYSGLSRVDIVSKTFDTFSPQTTRQSILLKDMQSWKPGDDNCGLFLFGPPGTGKTHLAKAALIKFASKSCKGAFCTVASLMDELRDDVDNVSDTINSMIVPDILVLDDFGAEKSTEWAQEKLLTILDLRMRAKKCVLMTSNLDANAMSAKYDMRILDRLYEAMRFIRIDGDSYRKKIYLDRLNSKENK